MQINLITTHTQDEQHWRLALFDEKDIPTCRSPPNTNTYTTADFQVKSSIDTIIHVLLLHPY